MLKSYGVDSKLIRLLEKVYEQSVAAVIIGTDIGTWFKQSLGTKQGDPMSPLMFISNLERIMDNNDEETTKTQIQMVNMSFNLSHLKYYMCSRIHE